MCRGREPGARVATGLAGKLTGVPFPSVANSIIFEVIFEVALPIVVPGPEFRNQAQASDEQDFGWGVV